MIEKPVIEVTESKPLSSAQRAHLAGLVATKAHIESEIEHFMAYLAAEHNAPADQGWTQIHPEKGFVRTVAG